MRSWWMWGCGRRLAGLLAGSVICFEVMGVYGQEATPPRTGAAAAETADETCRRLPTTDCTLAVALIASPDVVLVGQTISVAMRVTNSTDADVKAVTPSSIRAHGSGGATILTGPLPPLAIIPASSSHAFAFTFLVTEAGTLIFHGDAEGVQTGSLDRIRSHPARSELVIAQLPSLTTTLAIAPEAPIPGQTLTMTMTATNVGKTTIGKITPSVALRSDPAVAVFLSGPVPPMVSLPSGASHAFIFTYQVNQEGPLHFTARVSGTDTETGKAVAAPDVSSTLMAVAQGHLIATLVASPSSVELNQTVELTMTVENQGTHQIDAVVPSLVTPSRPASVRLSDGPVPVSATIAPGTAQLFTFTYQMTKPGTLTFTAHAVGTDSVSKVTIKSPRVTSNPVTVSSPVSGDAPSVASQLLETAGFPGSEPESSDRHPNTPPFGYLFMPRSDAKVGGTVAVVGGAFDQEDDTIGITILLDGAAIGSVTATSHMASNTGQQDVASADYRDFSFDWDTTATTPGPHTLAIQATDSQGKSTIFGTRTVMVVGPNNPPVGFLDLPFPDATIGGMIEVAGWAVDKEDPALALTIFLDGAPLATPAPAERPELEAVFQSIPWARHSGFTYEWDTSTTSPGQHTLAILATDPQGEGSLFGTRTVTVTGSPNSPPFGFFAPPPAIVRLGSAVPLVGTASDREDASVTVAPLLDGVPIETPIMVPTNGNFQFMWDTAVATAGPHILAIQATDSQGASAIIGIRRVTLVR